MVFTQLRPLAVSITLLAPSAALAAPTCADRSAGFEAQVTLCQEAFAAASNADDAAMALGYKGEAERMLGRLDDATKTLEAALRLAPQNPWYWVELGNVRSDGHDPAGALAYYSAALDLDPKQDYARLNRAEAWWQLHAPDRCITDSGMVLANAPDDPWANLVQGRCLTDLGRAEDGLAHLDRALTADPAWVLARMGRVMALLALDRAEEALVAADEVLADLSAEDLWVDEDLHVLRLQAIAESQSLADTLAEADALAADYPDNPVIPALRILGLTGAGRLDEAETAAKPLREGEAAGGLLEGRAHDALGQLDLAQGRTESALRRFDMAMALEPALTRHYARRLSEIGFLPLTASRRDVGAALQRCLTGKGKDCRLDG